MTWSDEDSEAPAIGLARAAVPWDDVQDHIKIAHHPILVLPEGSTQYAGAYWTGTQMAVTGDLGVQIRSRRSANSVNSSASGRAQGLRLTAESSHE